MGTITLDGWIGLAGLLFSVVGAGTRWLNGKLTKVLGRIDLQDKAKLEFENSVDKQHRELGERVARLEGPVKQIAESGPGQ